MRFAQVFGTARALALCFLAAWPAAAMEVAWWVSSEDMLNTLTAQPGLALGPEAPGADLRIDDTQRYQTILGLGASLDHATCYNISQLPPGEQERAVEWIVSPYTGIGMNLMRICIGTPDFTPSPWYTYADIPGDLSLEHFSIEKDREYVLPILKMALEINPDLLFFASPWSPPGWMTSNGHIGGGRFDSAYYAPYARYLAKFIKAYEAEGIPIYAITLQNEPDYNPPTYPTCRWTFKQQAEFIASHVGPEFERQGIQTRLWCWDHNFEPIGWPRNVLNDPMAAPYIDGTAFHHYAGRPSSMARLSAMFPSKHIYFTEGSTSGVRGAIEIIAILRNWGIPARYVSGYLFTDRELGDRSDPDATHAWVEVFLPSLRWVGIDPTNNTVAGERHVSVAIGRDYDDVPPSRGVYKGEAESQLAVAVSVRRARAALAEPEFLRVPKPAFSGARRRVAGAFSHDQHQQQQQ